MRKRLTRRRFMAVGGASLLAMAGKIEARAAHGTDRVIVFDWGLAETLLGLGAAPVGIAEAQGYRQWVVEPELPQGVAEVGLRIEPNFEMMAHLKPDLILITPELAPLKPLLGRLAQVEMAGIYTPQGKPFERAAEAAAAIGKLLGREAESAALIERTGETIAAARRKFAPDAQMPVYLVNFLDKRHVRVYGPESVFGAVLSKLGLKNAINRSASFWGFSTFGIEHLAQTPDAQLIYFEPAPPDFDAVLSRGALWRALPFVRQGKVGSLPPVWAFGGLPSAARLARLLGEHLRAASLARGETGGGAP